MLLFQSMSASDALWANQTLGWEIICNGDDFTAEVYDRNGVFLGTVSLN